jgi:hypothetical protein
VRQQVGIVENRKPNPKSTTSIIMRTLVFCLGLFLLQVGVHVLEAGENNENPRITDLRAFLYYHEKGEFSRQDLLSGQMALWNVIIGEGDAEGHSGALLVLVTVSPPVHGDLRAPSLSLSVKYANRTTTNQEITLRPFRSLAKPVQVPFLVYNTGCEHLEITARLKVGKQVLGSASRTAPFKCGE